MASEVAGKVTTIIVETEAMVNHLSDVYAYADRLAPSIVFLEDVDTALADRSDGRGSGSKTLHQWLQALDGPATSDEAVVTIATTNHLDAIDPAARRASRIDRVVEFPPPDRDGRRSIVRQLCSRIGVDGVEVELIADSAEGASGADLRELFRHALLSTDGPISTETLMASLTARGLSTGPQPGFYL